ncbi:hypothetical protein ROZALSC1DRAFT_27752 [Rozella allomycis CSF55]|uniref:Uncharacterized protein n=1 Tax=Rozella allomycis (strain CSF55) TaxID=988480 RepID=A0A075AX84_ROZAC|nr:hypothetical protein O9G_004121 [Rozella allomycis CSF55]RKP20790.1 hypothetical protein ROZALSC1DRAFT_27752 [Rozella allomycis CSF55]|eukprot:EPZ34754.1 hypothetical protein O9G_004121 [Rozella allomycis CSF55]
MHLLYKTIICLIILQNIAYADPADTNNADLKTTSEVPGQAVEADIVQSFPGVHASEEDFRVAFPDGQTPEVLFDLDYISDDFLDAIDDDKNK